MKARHRIDHLLVERGLVESRHKAQALLMAGKVRVNGQTVDKPARQFAADCEIRLTEPPRFVSRAGAKLQAALEHFGVPVQGRVAADLGASTGGFTDCLLQAGARQVHAFDVGRGQLAWSLQTDPRVVVRDECNVRNLSPALLPDEISLVSIDLAFISVKKVLPNLVRALARKGMARPVDVIVLVKPQFELARTEVGKGGIVRDEQLRDKALESVCRFAAGEGLQVLDTLPSPTLGAKGNQEFLLYLRLAPDLSSPT